MPDQDAGNKNLKVYVRLRSSRSPTGPPICQKISPTNLLCQEPGQVPLQISTDGVFAEDASQCHVFEETITPLLQSSVANHTDACIILYGAESSGKSFTLFGNGHDHNRGMLLRFLESEFITSFDGSVNISITEVTNDSQLDLTIYYRRYLHSSNASTASSQVRLSFPGELEGLLQTALQHRSSPRSMILITFHIGSIANFTFIEASQGNKEGLVSIEDVLMDVSKGTLGCVSKVCPFNQQLRRTFSFNCQPILITTMIASELSSISSAWFIKRLSHHIYPQADSVDFLLKEVQRLSSLSTNSNSDNRRKSSHENEPLADNQKLRPRRPSTSNVYNSRPFESRKLQPGYQSDLVMSGRSDHVRDNKIKNLQEKLEKSSSELLKLTALSLSNESKFFAMHQQNTSKIKELEDKLLMKEVEMRQRIDEIEHIHVKALETIARENREMVERARKEVRLNVLKLEPGTVRSEGEGSRRSHRS